MASLRTRLIAGLLVVAAAGLILLGAITYAEQRSFLVDRVDQQARSASPAVTHALEQQGVSIPGARDRSPDGDDRPPPRGGGGDRGGPTSNLPPGTYGQLRDSSGKVLGHVVLSYGETAPAAPDLPARLPVDKAITVPAKGDSGLRYRV